MTKNMAFYVRFLPYAFNSIELLFGSYSFIVGTSGKLKRISNYEAKGVI
jgi:hypothetical protein